MKIDGSTKFAGIIGHPIDHTLSPVFQNAAFRESGLNWLYIPFDVHPDRLESAVQGLAACGCRGFNVTMPHKQAMLDLVDEVDQSADMVKAVNTVEFSNGRSIGHNTDGPAFISSLKRAIDLDPMGKSALVVGAGGAAQSVALSLAKAGAARIKILNRTAEKAEKIVGLIRRHYSDCAASIGDIDDPAEVMNCDVVINATSVGMAVNPGIPVALDHLESGQVVYDVIYWPSETEFLRLAKKKGARTINGASMLLHQGAAAFTIWTGLPAPIDQMEAALQRELSERGTKDLSATNKQSAGKNITRDQTDHPGAAGRSQGG